MSTGRISKFTALTTALALCAMVSGCFWMGPSDEEVFAAKLKELGKRNQIASLSVLTYFEWDTVHLFEHPYGAQEGIDAELGPGRVEVYEPFDSTPMSLLVFENKGEIALRLPINTFIGAERITWSNTVVAAAIGNDYGVRLVDPITVVPKDPAP